MDFKEHTHELKNRTLIVFTAWVCLFIISLYLAPNTMEIIKQKILGEVDTVILYPFEGFFVYLTTAFYLSLILIAPIFLYHIYRFITLEWTNQNKKNLNKFLSYGTLFSGIGFLFSFNIILPITFEFTKSTSFGNEILLSLASAYWTITYTTFLFCFLFQTPIFVKGLRDTNLMSLEELKNKRKIVYFVMLVIGGLITPDGNPLTMLLTSVPLLGLYEVGLRI